MSVDSEWRVEALERLKQGTTELNCELCHKVIGFVNAFDLEGSYFYCADCRAQPQENDASTV